MYNQYNTQYLFNIYLPRPLHEYQHHETITHSQYQRDHSQMTNAKAFVCAVVITIIRYL